MIDVWVIFIVFEVKIIKIEVFILFYCKVVCILIKGGVVGLGYVKQSFAT